MKVKTSITLSEDLVKAMDALIQAFPEEFQNRSMFLESAAREFIKQKRHAERTARDIEIINRRADFLNVESLASLSHQADM